MSRPAAAVLMGAALCLWGTAAGAQAAGASHYDLNVYPALTGGGAYDLTTATVQSGPPGTVTMNSSAPSAAYSFKELLANTHGYVSTGVSSRGGYGFEAGVTMPLMPGKVDLDVGGGTGQIAGLPSWANNGKHSTVTYDSYYADLRVHPTDDFEASIGISGLRLHGSSPYAYEPFGAP